MEIPFCKEALNGPNKDLISHTTETGLVLHFGVIVFFFSIIVIFGPTFSFVIYEKMEKKKTIKLLLSTKGENVSTFNV